MYIDVLWIKLWYVMFAVVFFSKVSWLLSIHDTNCFHSIHIHDSFVTGGIQRDGCWWIGAYLVPMHLQVSF